MSDINLAHIASPDVIARARKIKLFLMDVDGTLTDGGVCLISSTAAHGSGYSAVSEMKVFNAHDGQGLSLAHTMGIQMGFKTASTSSWQRCGLCGSERIVRLVPPISGPCDPSPTPMPERLPIVPTLRCNWLWPSLCAADSQREQEGQGANPFLLEVEFLSPLPASSMRLRPTSRSKCNLPAGLDETELRPEG
jgi:hypothetical protein